MPRTILLLCAVALTAAAQDPSPAEAGRAVFRIYCAPCHGIQAKGGRGPDLTRTASAADADLKRTIRNGVPGSEMPAFGGDMDEAVIAQLVAYIRSTNTQEPLGVKGDASAGERIFWSKGGCGGCHKVGGRGGALGPDLTRIGRQRSFAYLRESVVSPDADITPGYETITVVSSSGKKIQGVARGYDNFTAQLVDFSGKFYSFDKAQVNSMTREFRSLMPGDYQSRLTASELDDLLSYLTALRGAQ